MVDNALLEQVMKLDADARLELRDAIESCDVRRSLQPERDFLRVQSHYDEAAPHQTDRFVSEVFAAARALIDHHETPAIAVVSDSQDREQFVDRLG